MLFSAQRIQTLWLAGLLGCAVVAEVGALWSMRQAWRREVQLGQLKDDFVASVSHELRAPLASMRLMAENLESGAVAEPARMRQYHGLLAQESRRLATLVDNVLDFARIEQNRRVYHFVETDLAALVRDAVEIARPQAAARRQEIALELAAMEPPVCDGIAVRQALLNLLDNASKFSGEGTKITVTARPREADAWEISVADEGPGIPAEEHEHIFERFYRLGDELRRGTQGSGIGLSIVQHIVAGHGGTIEVESRPGAGARFTLVFPRRVGGDFEEAH
jgi:two-component system phosphate regulon sensor histidine kinase PhoR